MSYPLFKMRHSVLFPPMMIIAIGICAFVGWTMNIIKVIGALDDPTITPMFAIRILGILAAPLGAILGWF